MQPINPSTKNQINKILNSIHNDLERLVEIKMNIDEFKLIDNYKQNTDSILDSINDIRFQISDTHFEEQKEMEEENFKSPLIETKY